MSSHIQRYAFIYSLRAIAILGVIGRTHIAVDTTGCLVFALRNRARGSRGHLTGKDYSERLWGILLFQAFMQRGSHV